MPAPFLQLLKQLGRDNAPIRLAWSTAADGFRTGLMLPIHLESVLEQLNAQGADVWWEVQPSIYEGERGRSSAQHVSAVRVLYADLDYKPKPGGIGSYPEALDVVTDLEGALGVPAAAIVHSGHGIQPYWVLEDGDIADEDARSRMAILLRRWGLMVSMFAANQQGGVDNVYDLPRILRVPGTVNHKSEPLEVRLELRDSAVAVDVELLGEAFDDYEVPVPSSDHLATAAAIVSPHAGWDWAEHDCDFVATVRTEIAESSPASRHHWALKWAALLHGMIRNGCLQQESFAELQRLLVTRFHYLVENEGTRRKAHAREVAGIMRAGLAKAEAWDGVKFAEEMRQHIHPETFRQLVAEQAATVPTGNALSVAPTEPAAPLAEDQTATQPASSPAAPVASIFADPPADIQARDEAEAFLRTSSFAAYSDTDNASKLAVWLQGRYVHVHGLGWHRWNGHRYEADEAGLVIEEAKRMVIRMGEMAQVERAAKWAHQSLGGGKLKTMIELATTVDTITVAPSQLDGDPEVLNTPAGVVDLRAGTIRGSDPRRDMLTLTSHVAPDRIPTPRWDAFLAWAMAEDDAGGERCRYLQRLFGAALVGELRWHILPLLVGSGGNGKSVLFDLAASLLGSYAHILPRRFFIEKRGEAHPTEIAALRGKRLAIASEVPPNATFDEDLVKVVTGEARLTGRFMGKDFFTFPNATTFMVAVNHLPTVSAGGNGFWRRMRKIDFTRSLTEDQQNPYLVQELLHMEGPGIMQWMVDGAREVLTAGLQDPAVVMRSTREYRMQEDAISRYLDEVLMILPGTTTGRDHVYSHYANWARAQGMNVVPQPVFEREVIQNVPEAGSGTRNQFVGIAMPTVLLDSVVGEGS